jgi:hypothetical protein
LHRGSDSSILSDPPPTFRLPSPVTAIFEIVQPHSTSLANPLTGESFFRRTPLAHVPAVEDW